MNPISAIALCFWMVIVGLAWAGAITASMHFLGIVAIIAAIVILIDTFVHFWIARRA